MIQSPPTLVAALIARDEARCIERCLGSVRPWVDRIVLLDTGSADGTPGIAKRCGAEVHHLDWPNDFSAARNHVLRLADADWTLMLDADEWIGAGGDLLRAWCAGPQRLGVVCIESSFDGAAGEPASSRSWITRLLPRGTTYQGRVHEQVVSPLPRERIALHLGHDGYREAQLGGKRDRNRPLLLLDLGDHPDDPYILFQLGRDAEGRQDLCEAADFYARSFQRTEASANWRHELTIRFLHCLGKSGRLEEAMVLAEDWMEIWAESPDFFFVLGDLLLDRAMGDPAHALDQWIPLATMAWERCLEIGERPDLEGSVAGRGSHLAQHNLDVLRSQLALVG